MGSLEASPEACRRLGGVLSKCYFDATSRRSYEQPMEDRSNVLHALEMSRRTTASVNIDGEIARNYKRMHEAEVRCIVA